MSTTPGGLWIPKLEFSISALVLRVKAELHGEAIKGFVTMHEDKYQELPNVLEKFLNLEPSPAAILKFTKQYGPVPLLKRPGREGFHQSDERTWRLWPGDDWEFTLDQWREQQTNLREAWRHRSRRKPGPQTIDLWHEDILQFHHTKDQISLHVCNLERFFKIRLHALPAERMKQCNRSIEDGCKTPFFVAEHLRQEYCSHACASWAQRAIKREWWRRRQEKSKGGK